MSSAVGFPNWASPSLAAHVRHRAARDSNLRQLLHAPLPARYPLVADGNDHLGLPADACAEYATMDAATVRAPPDWPLRLVRREHRDILQRLAVPEPGGRLAHGPLPEGLVLVFADHISFIAVAALKHEMKERGQLIVAD